MEPAFNSGVGDVLPRPPSVLDKSAVEQIGVPEVTSAFRGAHIKPDHYLRSGLHTCSEIQDAAVIPPQRGRHHGQPPKYVRVFQAQEERDKAAERRSTEPGINWPRQRSILCIDKRLEFLDEKPPIFPALSATHLEVSGGCVLCHAPDSRVGNADKNERTDRSRSH